MSESPVRQSAAWLGWRLYGVVGGAIVVVLTLLILTTVPLWLIGAAVLSLWMPGHWRPLRLLLMLTVWLVLESLVLLALLVLWVISGFGWAIRRPAFQHAHYACMGWFLGAIFAAGLKVLRVELVTQGPAPDTLPGAPLLVLSRHAGPGDSFTLVHALLNSYDRKPRVVLKNTLAFEPAIGIFMHRLPNRFVRPNPRPGEDLRSQITELASGLDGRSALLIFPEGGNYTAARRDKAIERLRALGLEKMAERAQQWDNVLAPRPGGVVAALQGAPDADVLLCAHTGLDHLFTVLDLWRELPMDKRLTLAWWRVPRSEIPTESDLIADWLFTRWAEIDEWVAQHRAEPIAPRSRRSDPAAPGGPGGRARS